MPRGAEYANEPPASDNAIDAGTNKVVGAPQGDSDACLPLPLPTPIHLLPASLINPSPSSIHLTLPSPYQTTNTQNQQAPTSTGVDRSSKAAPLPEGISEMKDQSFSGQGSQGLTGGGSGKGGVDEPYVDRAAEELTKEGEGK